MDLKRIGMVLRGAALVGVLSGLLAACDAPVIADATDGPNTQPTPLFVELDDDINVDDIIIRGAATDVPVVPDELPLSEADARLPFTVALPASVPAGFVLGDTVQVVAPEQGAGPGEYASVIVTWEDADGASVQYSISTLADEAPAVGAVGSGTPVTVRGQPGTLQQTTGLGPDRVTLTWASGDLAFRLTASGGVLTGDDLLAMAESIP